jgi:tripartite-type tricarboxylate transporter receptor subunit TctC
MGAMFRLRLLRRWVFGALLVGAGALAVPSAQAQDPWPSHPVKVIVPSAAGGGTDTVGRLLTQYFSEKLGAQFYVDNRPGAGSMLGSEAAARSAPDGYSLLVAPSTLTSLHVTRKTMRYDAVKDFEPVSMIVALPNVIVVHPSLPVKNLQDLILLAKQRGEPLAYATPGVASNSHMSMEMLAEKAGIKLLHVPYNGVAPALTDVLGSRVPVMLVNLASALPHIESGALRPIAVTTLERSKILPEVPTVSESGLEGYESYQWFGLLAPKGTPVDIVAKLNQACVDALKTEKVGNWVKTEAGTPVGNTPAEFSNQIAEDVEKWTNVAKAAGVERH